MKSLPFAPLGIIFDLDGTLLDSLTQAYAAVCHIFTMSGLEPPTFETYFVLHVPPFIEFYRGLGVKAEHEVLNTWYHEVARHEEAELFQDTVETLEALLKKKFLIGVISCQPQARLEHICLKRGILHHFHLVLGSTVEKVGHITTFCHKHKLDPQEVWYVGDWTSDMRDAKKAGVTAIGITRGKATRNLLYEAGADHCVEHLDELVKLMQSRRRKSRSFLLDCEMID